jgi:[protein-PII] uridylyltransferase
VPEFGRLTCLVQHEFYHQYTADEHTLVCLQRLDEVWGSKDPAYQSYTQILQKVERPFVLYLALLLHDTGKADGDGQHIDAGVRLARRAAKRLGLDAPTSELLALLVEQHVLLPQVSQRRDLEDPAVIRRVASRVRSVEALNLLTLLTLADALGTSDKLWNGFKDSLLWSLYHKTLKVLGAGTEYILSEERQREQLLEAVRREVKGRLTEEELHAHFTTFPANYYQIHSAARIAVDVELVHRFIKRQFTDGEDPLAPVVAWRNEPDRGHTAVTVCTWDRAGLFSKIAGSMSAAGLNILGAQVFTRTDGIVLDTLFVIDARTDTLAKPEAKQSAEETLTRALTGKPVDFRALIAKHQGSHTPYQAPPGERMPTSIRFENALDDVPTVIEVETEDRIGLLFAISEAMSELGLDILVAKISTEKGAVFDVFYVIEEEGNKVLSVQRQKTIEARLRKTVAELEG